MITVGSLFAGIGGIDLGLERTGGFKTIWFSEIEPYCCKVLEKNFPGVPNIGDITKVDWDGIERPKMLTGGFPCQDISWAGKGKGIKEGTRSGLWFHFAKAIRTLRPELVLVENVPALTHRGLSCVLASLTEAGYNAEWFTLSASEVGAMHKRERVFIIAHTNKFGCTTGNHNWERGQISCDGVRETSESFPEWSEREFRINKNPHIQVADTDGGDVEAHRKTGDKCKVCTTGENITPKTVEDALTSNSGPQRVPRFFSGKVHQFPEFSWCKDIRSIKDLQGRCDIPQPLIRGKVNGVPCGMDNYKRTERTKAIGNAVCPQVAQQVGEWILEGLEYGT